MEILWILNVTPSYYESFVLEIDMMWFFGQNLTISEVIVAKQKIICKRHKVRNKYVLRFLLEFITVTCSKTCIQCFFLTHPSVAYATTMPLKSLLEHQLLHLQVTFSPSRWLSLIFCFCLNYRWKRGVFNGSIHSQASSTILQGKCHCSTHAEMFLLFIEVKFGN